MKRVCIFHPYFLQRGGAERKILLLAKYLKSKEIDITIYTFDLKLHNTFSELIDVNDFQVLPSSFLLRILILRKELSKYDVAILSNYPANLYSIFTNHAIPKLWICNEIALLLKPKNNPLHNFALQQLDKLSCKFINKIISNSSNTSNYISKYYNKSSLIIHSGIDIEYFNNIKLIKPNSVIKSNKFIHTVTRISEDKNLQLIEKLLNVIPNDVVFYIAGIGPDTELLLELENKYSNFKYLGAITEQEKKWLFTYSELFVFMPENEPLGVTLIESLYYNCPSIAYSKGGPLEICPVNYKLLVKSESDYLKLALNILCNPKLSMNTTEWIIAKFSLDRMNKEFFDAAQALVIQ